MDDGRETAIGTGIAARHCPCRPYEPQHDQWSIKKKVLTPIADTIQPLKERPILELDELWSFVTSKANKQWIWLALERQTRRIVGFAIGDRSQTTCQELWASLPPDYRKRAVLYTDLWEPYALVLPSKRHRPVG